MMSWRSSFYLVVFAISVIATSAALAFALEASGGLFAMLVALYFFGIWGLMPYATPLRTAFSVGVFVGVCAMLLYGLFDATVLHPTAVR